MKQVAALDAVWLELESRDTPMHVGGLLEFTLPKDAPPDYLKQIFEGMRSVRTIPPPWNLRLVEPPLIGPRLPLMREVHDVDLDYHVRHSALPHPGGQRELGILVSRLHSNQLDLHRPLWEAHLIEGLAGNRFAMYTKTHHSLIDGVSSMRLIMRALSTDPDRRDMAPFWGVGAGSRPRAPPQDNGSSGVLAGPLSVLREGAASMGGLSRAAFDLARAAVDSSPLQAPYRAPESALGGRARGPAPLRHPAVRPQAPEGAWPEGRVHAERDRSVPVRQRAAQLPGRARPRAPAPPHRRHPGEPARGRRPVDGNRRRHDRGRARDQHRRPAGAPDRRSSARAPRPSATCARSPRRPAPPTRC